MKKKLFIGVYNPSIILTYISVFCSVYGIGNLMFNDSANILKISMILLMIAGICDLFDGRVARMCDRTKKEEEFGVQLDSLADTVSFVVFPLAILLHITQFSIPSILISMLYTFGGIMRLAWFNVTVEENKGFFCGLPVTSSAIIFPFVYFIARLIELTNIVLLYEILFIIVGIAFILNFKFKKPGFKFAIAAIVFAIALIVGLIII